MEKFDIRKVRKELYSAPTADFVVVDVPPLQYLLVDGHGDPNTSKAHSDAIEALYSVSYAMKFDSKKNLDQDFVVGPLEGTWRADDMTTFETRDKSSWDWTMMICQPDWVNPEMFEAAIDKVGAKKTLPAIPLLRLVTITEGTSVQILHIGSYDDEAPTLSRLHNEYLPKHGLAPGMDHHEIYLSDPRRTAAEKLKTILRQPVVVAPSTERKGVEE